MLGKIASGALIEGKPKVSELPVAARILYVWLAQIVPNTLASRPLTLLLTSTTANMLVIHVCSSRPLLGHLGNKHGIDGTI